MQHYVTAKAVLIPSIYSILPRAVLQRFRQVGGLDLFLLRQIGDSAGDFDDARANQYS